MTLAIFDFDGTMIPGDSIVSYLFFARKKGLLSAGRLLWAGLSAGLYRLGLMDAGRAKSAALAFRKDVPAEKLDSLDRAFARELLRKIRPDALCAMNERKSQGDTVILLTASTDHYMRFVAEGLPADRLICSVTDRDGRVLRNLRGSEKAAALNEYISSLPGKPDLSASCAFGDSASDLPLLRLTGHPFLVNPGRKALKRAGGTVPVLHWQ